MKLPKISLDRVARVGVVLTAITGFFALSGFTFGGSTHVDGYTRRDGTYVSPHYRSSPNHTYTDNWSYSGNYNPYTGARGTKSYDPIYPSYSGYGSSYGGY